MHPTATIDLKNRSLRVPHALSATVVTGPDKLRSGFGNGDCLLMDAPRGVFAVADASERHPRASRRLLTRLHKILVRQDSDTDPGSLANRLEEAYTQQKYTHKSTLSGIALSHTAGQVTIHLFHGGDSMVMVVHADDGRILLSTRPDMNFAGRIRQGVGVSSHTFSTDIPLRVILATDGFGEILKALQVPDGPKQSQRTSSLLKELVRAPLQDMEKRVRHLMESDPGRPFHDDIAVMVLDPAIMKRLPRLALTMGGTSPRQEAAFARNVDHGWPEPELTDDLWQDHTDVLRTAGIRFLPDGADK
ncbi:MAG: SpoIIE family protein phosphatase [Desulfobacterales bacterium]|nr:SpoIIE family protein phosphatase [Desulfobacterales bacterium]